MSKYYAKRKLPRRRSASPLKATRLWRDNRTQEEILMSGQTPKKTSLCIEARGHSDWYPPTFSNLPRSTKIIHSQNTTPACCRRVPQSHHALAHEFLRANIVLRGLFCSTRTPVFSFKRVGGSASHINMCVQHIARCDRMECIIVLVFESACN